MKCNDPLFLLGNMKLLLSRHLDLSSTRFYSVYGMKRKIIVIKWSTLRSYQDQIIGRFSFLCRLSTSSLFAVPLQSPSSHFLSTISFLCSVNVAFSRYRFTRCRNGMHCTPLSLAIKHLNMWNAWHVQNLNVILGGRSSYSIWFVFVVITSLSPSWLRHR